MLVSRSARCLARISAHRQLLQKRNLIAAFCESRPKSIHPPRVILNRRFASASMASLETITQALAALSIKPTATVSHTKTNSPDTWRQALASEASAPESFELIKTLVFKPKTAKNATAVPVVVIASDKTETASGALGKKLNLKDLRLASEDLLTEFFSLDKNSRTFPIRDFC